MPMPASRIVKWGVAAVVAVAVSAFVYAGVAAAHSASDPAPNFLGPTYSVTFSETGLAAGTNWTVTVYGPDPGGHGFGFLGFHGFRFPIFPGHSKTSDTSTIAFSLPNGTYQYLVHRVAGYNLTGGAHGKFSVTGASPATIAVTFAKIPTYTVTFQETGLASGTPWTVHVTALGPGPCDLGRGQLSATSSSSSITFSLPNGTYRYDVRGVAGYTIADSGWHGTFSVTGASPATIHVVFVRETTYQVTFTETGLPHATNWSVVVFSAWGPADGPGGVLVGTSNTTTITFSLTNGTYGYFVPCVPGYAVKGDPFGTFNVTGASPSPIAVTFVPSTCPSWPPVTPLVGATPPAPCPL